MSLEDIRKYSLDIILTISLIILAEILIFTGNMTVGMVVHALTLMLLILSSIYIESRVYSALVLLPLFRLLNVAMPVFFQMTIYSYPLVYAPMFIPIYLLMKEHMLSRSEAGITWKGFWFYLPLATAIGFALGWGEYHVLAPGLLTPDLSVRSILILVIIMILFVGVVEEFIFRSALQTVMEERLGSVAGLLATSIIFGFMHSGYHVPLEILYVSFAGLVFGLLFWTTRSLPILAIAHGFTNIALFLVAPVYSEALVYLVGISGVIVLLYALRFKKMPIKPEPG